MGRSLVNRATQAQTSFKSFSICVYRASKPKPRVISSSPTPAHPLIPHFVNLPCSHGSAGPGHLTPAPSAFANSQGGRGVWHRPHAPARRTAASLLLLLTLLLVPLAVRSQTPVRTTSTPRRPAPKLLVVLVIDQFRSDTLDLFRGKFGDGGFKRLEREAAVFHECHYPYAITDTGPGHATIATGTTPDRHGIVANDWYDAARRKIVYALLDDTSPVIGGSPGLTSVSPRNLIGSTLSDELRLATRGASRVYGVAIKDRAAILSTGHGANGAYWYDSKSGAWVSSKYYGDRLADYITEFSRAHPVAQPAELPYTAAGNRLTVELAEAIIDQQKLGADKATDFLFVGLSANDYAGHRWGPYSKEVEQMTIETDALLAGLLSYLDEHVGHGSYWLALSADHGIPPTIDQARQAQLDARLIDEKALHAAAEAALVARWGSGHWFLTDNAYYLDRATLGAKNVSMEDAVRVAGEAASGAAGVWGYASRFGSSVSETVAQAYRLNDFPGRSPDLYVVFQPFNLPGVVGTGTTHGTPFTYDQQVPLILLGTPFVPGDYYEACTPGDMAVTLAAMLHIHAPALATGRVLTEALRRPPVPFPIKAPQPGVTPRAPQ